MASITVSGIDVGNVNEGSRFSYPTGLTATFDNIREVILASYPTADLFKTIFTFDLSVAGTTERADFIEGNLNLSYFVRLDGSVSLPPVGTINDSDIEGDETFSLQPILNDLSIDLEDGSRIRLNPSQIEALFAGAGGFTLNIGSITGTIVDNDFPNQAPTAVNFTPPASALNENSDTTDRIKVADVTITDDGQGTNVLSLSGSDADAFELVGTTLYLKAGTILDFETQTSYSVTVNVDDAAVGSSTPDASNTFTLSVNDLLENVAPVANSDTTSTSQNTPLSISSAELLANDTDANGDTLSITAVSNASGGTVSFNNGNVLFTPNEDFTGAASFDYTISDGQESATTTVTVTVASVAGINRPGTNGRDTIIGGLGRDTLSGGNGDDLINGGSGSDILNGNNGNDMLIGGTGNDTVTGGNGNDVFVLAAGAGTDTMTDFKIGTDVIGLSGGLSFAQLSRSGNTISIGSEVLATLTGVNTATLTQSDFIAV